MINACRTILLSGAIALAAIPVVRADNLFQANGYQAIAADHKAYRPGDNLTVLVTEIASATSTANTTTSKDGTLLAKLAKRTANINLSTELGDTFNGGGQTERTGKLNATITVTVQSIDDQGVMTVKGEQTIDVNNERQSIKLTGRVRPEDIGPDNTVASSRITDAHIEYVGNGVLAEKAKPGLLTRLLSWLRIL